MGKYISILIVILCCLLIIVIVFIDKVKRFLFMQWSQYRPILMFILWYLFIIVIVFIDNLALFKSFWAALRYFALFFCIALPIPFIIFPAIIISIGTKNNKSNPDYINGILYINGKKIDKINTIPFQCKFYCFHRTNYDVYLCYKDKIYHSKANLYEEKVCSLEIIVDD